MADARKEDDFSQFLKQADCPIVLVNRTLGIANTYDTITLDNMQGGYLATKHLLELGHRRIAMLRGPKFLQPVRDVTRDMSMHFRKPEFH